MRKPLLSVVVPTKDRYKYLKHLIKLIQSYNSDEWEIVVQDNTDDNTEILEFLKDLNYPGCKYFHEKGQLPMTTNADKAILHSEGEYVCFLGDDDGVCPNALEYCKLMKEKGYEALRNTQICYFWPEGDDRYGFRGNVIYPKLTKKMEVKDSKAELEKVLQHGCVGMYDIPSCYEGVASRKMLDKIYEKCGTYFPGQSPDISNGVAVSLITDQFLFVDDAIAISGASKFHGGRTIGNDKQFPQIKDMVWFRPGAEEIWDSRLPKIAVGSTIWPESTIETLKNLGREDLCGKINIEATYKYFAVYCYPIRKMVYPLTKGPIGLKLYANIYFVKRAIKALIRVVMGKLGVSSGQNRVGGLTDIEACVSALKNEN